MFYVCLSRSYVRRRTRAEYKKVKVKAGLGAFSMKVTSEIVFISQ